MNDKLSDCKEWKVTEEFLDQDNMWKALVECVASNDKKGAFGLINVYCYKLIRARQLCDASALISAERERFLRRESKVKFSDLFEDNNEQEE
jgi:hypothetical protein